MLDVWDIYGFSGEEVEKHGLTGLNAVVSALPPYAVM